MSLFAAIKSNAKNALRNNWFSAIAIMLIVFLTSALLSGFVGMTFSMLFPQLEQFYNMSFPSLAEAYAFLSANVQPLLQMTIVGLIFSLIIFLVMMPLELGGIYWYYQLVQGKPESVGEVFRYFESAKRFFRAIFYEINLTLRLFFWGMLFHLIPVGLCSAAVLLLREKAQQSANPQLAVLAIMATIVVSLLVIIVGFLYIVFIGKYFLAPYLMAEDTRKGGQAIRQSATQMKGHRFQLVWFELSFLGWALLCIFPPVLFYVYPYFQASLAMYAHYIIGTQKRETALQPVQEDYITESLPASEPVEDADEFPVQE